MRIPAIPVPAERACVPSGVDVAEADIVHEGAAISSAAEDAAAAMHHRLMKALWPRNDCRSFKDKGP
jgi:hypothetical protein